MARESGAMPLYQQLRAIISEKIELGEWAPGHKLPNEPALAAEFGVSRATMRQCLQLLEREGKLERRKGVGTVVSRPKIAHNIQLVGPTVKMAGRPAETLNVSFRPTRRIPAPPDVARNLDLPPRTEVFELTRILSQETEPVMLITSWLPVERYPGLDSHPADRSIRQLLHTHYGEVITNQHREIELAILSIEEAEALNCPAGAPALLASYVSSTAAAEPVEYRRWIIRGDRCKVYLDIETPEASF